MHVLLFLITKMFVTWGALQTPAGTQFVLGAHAAQNYGI